ncbi:PD-(D/E)XK nuclease family protein [Pseudoalteromonas atlantica]|uniref:PD-(D/E)XK nuclease family protein n=1 Tax=Pseudoalteromonas atlantica TaxID=288 RepID=UPI003A96B864
MDFAAKLKAKAAESGQQTIQGKSSTPKPSDAVKADSKEGLAAMLGARAKETKQKAVITQAPKNNKIKKAGDLNALSDALKQAKQTREDERGAMVVDFPTAAVKAWSFSTLKKFENCQWAVKLGKVDKIPVESGEAAQRGTVIHDGCEAWVRGDVEELPADNRTKFDQFSADFSSLREDYREGKITMEENWGIRKDWSPCDWDDDELWGRAKLDVFIRENENSCRIIDYKTGQKFGNEMKHADQGLSYALHTMHRFPEIDVFKVEFWYLDDGTKMVRTFNRRQLGMLLLRYHNRAKKLTTSKDFIPTANAHTCRFCEYGCNTNRDGKAYGNGACGFDHYRGLDVA